MLKMTAAQFNREYEVGSVFILSTALQNSNGKPVRTVAKADEIGSGAVVEINLEPWFTNIRNLTPTN